MPKPPCYKNGKDCEYRCVGCRNTCEEWQLYEIEKQKEYNRRKDIMLQEQSISDYESAKAKRLRRGK